MSLFPWVEPRAVTDPAKASAAHAPASSVKPTLLVGKNISFLLDFAPTELADGLALSN